MTRQTTMRRRRASRAASLLYVAGFTCRDLGEALGVSEVTVAQYLRGHRTVPARLPDALKQLVGADDARRILAAIPKPDTRPAA